MPPRPRFPAAGTIEIWAIDLDEPVLDETVDARLAAMLPEVDSQRAERFVRAIDGVRFRRCRAMLRLAVAHYLGTTPEAVAFTARWRDKPCLPEGTGLHFNVTHGRGRALLAFTTMGEIGVDLEPLARDVEALEIASSYFTAKETALIAVEETRAAQSAVFLRLWTRKEAVLKAAGCGIAGGLNEIDVSLAVENLVELAGNPDKVAGNRWLVRDLDAGEGFLAAVAAAPGEWTVILRPAGIEASIHSIGHVEGDSIERYCALVPRQ